MKKLIFRNFLRKSTSHEFVFWFGLAIVSALYFYKIAYPIQNKFYSIEGFDELSYFKAVKEWYAFATLLSLGILLIPYYGFKIVFTVGPLEFLSEQVYALRIRQLRKTRNGVKAQNFKVDSNKATDAISTNRSSNLLEVALKNAVSESREQASRIYTRSNFFLFIGGIIGITGIVAFYIQHVNVPNNLIHYQGNSNTITTNLGDHQSLTWPELFKAYLPNLGVLFFVEALAFFFLRQYSNAMEDFRYYYNMFRQRENQLTTYRIKQTETGTLEELIKHIDMFGLGSDPNRMLSNETTQLLEEKKITLNQQNEIEKLLDKIKGIVSISKSTNV